MPRARKRAARATGPPGALEILVAGAGHPRAARDWLVRHALEFDPDLLTLGLTLGNDPAQSWLARRSLQVFSIENLLLPDDAYRRAFMELLPVKLDRTLLSWRVYRRARLLPTEVISSWFRGFPTVVHLLDPGRALYLFYPRRSLPLKKRDGRRRFPGLAQVSET